MEKKIVWIDMDGVLVDFEGNVKEIFDRDKFIADLYKHNIDRVPGVFRNPKPIEGAVEAIHKLYDSGKYDMYIATAVPWGNPEGSTDKRYWIETHFGRMFRKKVAMTHMKNLLIGDYLIDDRTANGAGEFTGEHIHFGTGKFKTWKDVLDYLL
jgi:5'-nucleotidase